MAISPLIVAIYKMKWQTKTTGRSFQLTHLISFFFFLFIASPLNDFQCYTTNSRAMRDRKWEVKRTTDKNVQRWTSTTRTSTRNAFFNFDFFLRFLRRLRFNFSCCFAIRPIDRPALARYKRLLPSLESSVTLLSWTVCFFCCCSSLQNDVRLELHAIYTKQFIRSLRAISKCSHRRHLSLHTHTHTRASHFATALNFSLLTWIILCAACDSVHCVYFVWIRSAHTAYMFQGFRFIHMDEIASESFFFFFFFSIFYYYSFFCLHRPVRSVWLCASSSPLYGTYCYIEYVCAYCLVAFALTQFYNLYSTCLHSTAYGGVCVSLSYERASLPVDFVSPFLQTAQTAPRRCYANTDKMHIAHTSMLSALVELPPSCCHWCVCVKPLWRGPSDPVGAFQDCDIFGQRC